MGPHRIIAVLAGLILLSGCATAETGTDTTDPTGDRAIPLVSTDDLPAAAANEVHLFGLNDLHGNLQPPTGSTGRIAGHDAGGAAFLATHLARLRTAYPASAVVSVGDNVGASPLVSGLFHDEPTLRFLDNIGVTASAVGNHEFDDGVLELARMRRGGCAPDGCSPGAPFTGTTFPYLAANVTDARGKLPPELRPWTVIDVGGHKIGLVGTVTPETAKIVLPAGIRGYTFGDEVAAINRYVPEMRAAGAETVVALLHDGGGQGGAAEPDYNGCADISPTIATVAHDTNPAVSAILSAHTHQSYVCDIGGKVITQGASYGRLISDLTLRFTPDGVRASAVNRVVTRDVAPDEQTEDLVSFYEQQARPRAQRVIGTAATELPHAANSAPTSPLGDVIADSMLAATAGPDNAVAAFMNPGGVRADLRAGPITYGDIFTVQPFANQVVTLTMTGQQILRLLEQQWDDPAEPTVLSPSGLTYAYTGAGAPGQRVDRDSVRIAGRPLNPVATYRVTTNSFLASGGDGFSVFTEGHDQTPGPTDLDAFESFLTGNPTIGAATPRVQVK